MKRYAMIMAAAVAALSIASCQKEEIRENKALQYDFNIAEMSGYDGAATKSVKAGWSDGDMIHIIFDDACPTKVEDYMILKMVSGRWTVFQEPATAPSGSTLDAVYYENGNPGYYFGSGEVNFENNSRSNNGQYMVLVANNVNYEIVDNKLTASLVFDFLSQYSNQICITGLSEDGWYLKFQRTDGASNTDFTVTTPRWNTLNNRFLNWTSFIGTSYTAMKMKADGHYLHFSINGMSIPEVNKDWKFSLNKYGMGTWEKTFTNKAMGVRGALKMSGPSGITGEEPVGTVVNGWTRTE